VSSGFAAGSSSYPKPSILSIIFRRARAYLLGHGSSGKSAPWRQEKFGLGERRTTLRLEQYGLVSLGRAAKALHGLERFDVAEGVGKPSEDPETAMKLFGRHGIGSGRLLTVLSGFGLSHDSRNPPRKKGS
jgi:hypothetical protein